MTHTSPAVWRQKIGAVVLHQTTQLAILLIIVLNAIILGLQTSPAVVARWARSCIGWIWPRW